MQRLFRKMQQGRCGVAYGTGPAEDTPASEDTHPRPLPLPSGSGSPYCGENLRVPVAYRDYAPRGCRKRGRDIATMDVSESLKKPRHTIDKEIIEMMTWGDRFLPDLTRLLSSLVYFSKPADGGAPSEPVSKSEYSRRIFESIDRQNESYGLKPHWFEMLPVTGIPQDFDIVEGKLIICNLIFADLCVCRIWRKGKV